VPLIVPQAVLLHPVPVTLQLTAVLGFELGAGVSVAVYCAEAPAPTLEGPLSINVKPLVIWIAAEPDLAGSATLRAVSVTLDGDGRICGAV